MMKRIKIILIIFTLLILCGCSIKEEVVVDPYGKVSQKLTIPIDTDGKDKAHLQSYVDLIVKPYKRALDLRKYAIKTEYGKNKSKIIITNTFSNMCDYVENTVFSQYIYDKISCNEDENYITIKNESKHIDYCEYCTSWPSLDNVKYSITLPVNLEEHNADKVNGNTYIWQYDKNTPSSKGIYLKINKEDLKENLEKYNDNQDHSAMIKKIIFISIFVILILIAFIAYKKIYIKYKNNKMDY